MDSIHFIKDFKLLVLLGVANTMPIVAWHLFKDRFSLPVDFNKTFFDGRPILGPHKTWRGLIASVTGSAIAALLLGVCYLDGIYLAIWSMAGDMFTSFVKRRIGLSSGARFTGFDQAVESFLPVAVMKDRLGITWLDCLLITFIFTIVEIWISPFLFRIGFRRNPY
ncbi:MAG: CDP-archaeol synthase [Thermodesulfobacteria bacterium]|nr:CDP-archaeol synthase [Thermodesulfobacteriota bacterium]